MLQSTASTVAPSDGIVVVFVTDAAVPMVVVDESNHRILMQWITILVLVDRYVVVLFCSVLFCSVFLFSFSSSWSSRVLVCS